MEQEKRKPSKMFLRFAIGVPFGTIAICIIAFGNISLFLLVTISAVLALREFWRVTGVDHPGSKFPISYLGYIACVLLLYASWAFPTGSFTVLLAFMLPVFFIAQLIAKVRGAKEFLKEVATVFLGVIYIGGLLSFVFKLRHLQIIHVDAGTLEFSRTVFSTEGMIHLTIYPVLAGWGCDFAALFSGKYFGRTKLAPTISPKKTLMGLWGGMVGSTVAVIIYSYSIGLVGQVEIWELILFGVMVAAISQLGDLSVSALKREAQVKDAGKLLGAHGGMLDRLDGLLFALPVTYLFFLYVLG